MEKLSHMESTEEQMFIHVHAQFPRRAAAGQRWKDVRQIRGCQPQRRHLRWQLCANWAHVHLVHTVAAGTVWRGFDKSFYIDCFPFLVLSSTSTWCQLRHLMLQAVPVLSSSSDARARCASWVSRNTTPGNCFKFTRWRKLHAEFQEFNVVVSRCVFWRNIKNQEIVCLIYYISLLLIANIITIA